MYLFNPKDKHKLHNMKEKEILKLYNFYDKMIDKKEK